MKRLLLLSFLFVVPVVFSPAQAAEADAPAQAVETGTPELCAKGRIEVSQAPEKCPCCGAPSVAPIMYGLPDFSPELRRAVDAGELVLGGCVVSNDDPRWKCTKCKTFFYLRK